MTSTSTNWRAELAEFAPPEKKGGRSPREERIIAGFEEIQRFVEKHGRAPQHGEDRDIFERLYAVRLDRLRALEECRALLAPLDRQGLLSARVCRSRIGGEASTTTNCWPNLTGGAAGRATSPTCAMSARAPTSAPPRKSPSASRARTSRNSSRYSSGKA